MIAFAIGKGISAPLSFLLILVLAALMSRSEYASYIATVAVLEIGIVFGTLGIEWVTQTVVAAVRVRGNAAQLRHAVVLFGLLPVVPYLLLAGALWQFAHVLSSALGGVASVEVLRLYAFVLAIEGPTRMLRDSLMAVLLLQRTAQVSQVLRVLTTFGFVAAMAVVGMPITAADVARAEIAGAVVAMMTALVAVLHFLWAERPMRRMNDSIGQWLDWNSARFAGHAYGSLLMMLLVGTDMMTALVARYLGVDATAAFGFVVRLLETARRYLPMDMFWGVLRPAAIGRYEGNGRDAAVLMTDCNRMLEANLLVIGIGLAVALAAGDAIVLALSKGNVITPPLLLVAMLPLLATHTLRRTVELIAYTRGRSASFARAAIVSITAPPLVAAALAFSGAIYAAPIAVLAVDLAFIALAVRALLRANEPIRFHAVRWLRIAASLAIGGALGALTYATLPGHVGIAAAAAVAILAYVALVIRWQVIDNTDRAWLASAFNRRRGAGA